MRYQLNSFARIFLRYNLFFYILTIIIYMLISYNISTRPFFPPCRNDLFIMLGYYNDLNSINWDLTLVFVIYQLFLTFLTVYTYINYEKNNSSEFILLRTSVIKQLKIKMVINIVFIIIWRIMYFIFVYHEYCMKIKFKISDFFYSVGIHLLLITIIYVGYYIYINSNKGNAY